MSTSATTAASPASRAAPRDFVVTLSRDELAFVLRAMRAPHLPGFNDSWVGGPLNGKLSKDARPAFEAGAQALIARGFLGAELTKTQPPQPQLDLPAPVLALVGGCVFSPYVMYLALARRKEGRIDSYLYECQELGIAMWQPTPGVYGFQALNGRQAIVATCESGMAVSQQPAAQCPPGTIAVKTIESARDAALAGKVPDATQQLTRGGLSPATGAALADALANYVSMGAVALAVKGPGGKQPTLTEVGFVSSPRSCFLLTPQGSPAKSYQVQPVAATDLRQWIVSRLPAPAAGA